MRRCEFIPLLGGATAWPLAVRAQHRAVPVPVIGLLSAGAPEESASRIASFRQGLGETGYEEDRNLAIDYRWADGKYDRLPALAAELVRRPVNVLVGTTTPAALAAKAAATTIPMFSRPAAIRWRSALSPAWAGPARTSLGQPCWPGS